MAFVDGAREVRTAEVAVVGGGPAGLMSAIALAAGGVDTLLIARQPEDDHRTTTLLAGSVTALTTLGVWQACLPHAAPLVTIRIIDDTQRLLRAPEVTFTAADIGLDAFGYNIENRHLIAALFARAAQLQITRVGGAAVAVDSDSTGVTIELDDGAARVRLVVGADGQRSLCRAAAGIGTDRRAYPQTALTLNLAHDRPHQDTATEFHTESGPFTLVALPGRRSSLVWVLDPARAAELSAATDAELSAEIERRAHSLFGAVRVERGRGMFPLAVETAHSFARGRIALVGEAAHVVPPIGRRASISVFATPRRWPNSSPTRTGNTSTSDRRACSRATTPSAAPTRPAGGSPSTSSTAASCPISSRSRASAGCGCSWSTASGRCAAR
jgi:2-octaprenyl-6-methoxyphenol hydroxylase